jgi:hypothetical protein
MTLMTYARPVKDQCLQLGVGDLHNVETSHLETRHVHDSGAFTGAFHSHSGGHRMFNAARGSILIAMLFHYQMNLPIWPEAQPWENYLFEAVAVIVVIIERESMLRRGARVTEILASLPKAERRSFGKRARAAHAIQSTTAGDQRKDRKGQHLGDDLTDRHGHSRVASCATPCAMSTMPIQT